MSIASPVQAVPETREEKIALFVVLSALEDIICYLANSEGPLESVREVLEHDHEGWGFDPSVSLSFVGHDAEFSISSLLRELWPEDETYEDVPYEDRATWKVATTRADLLRSRMLAALTTDEARTRLADESSRVARLSDRALKTLGVEDDVLENG